MSLPSISHLKKSFYILVFYDSLSLSSLFRCFIESDNLQEMIRYSYLFALSIYLRVPFVRGSLVLTAGLYIDRTAETFDPLIMMHRGGCQGETISFGFMSHIIFFIWHLFR